MLAKALMLCCPITSQVKGYPFEVAVAGIGKIRGVILADQAKGANDALVV
jgi:mRNA interferase MazF